MIAEACTAAALLVAAAPRLLGLRHPARALPGEERTARPRPAHRTRMVPYVRLRRGRAAAGARWPETLDGLARATATGTTLAEAIREIGAAGGAPPALRAISRSQASGHALGAAVASANADGSDEALALATIGALATSGGPPTAALDRAAAILRERQAIAAERSVAAAQATASARVLVLLPIAVVLWSLVAGGNTADVLLGTPVGIACLVVGVILDLLGWRWMRRIIGGRR